MKVQLSKKQRLILTGLALLLVTVGTTFAWWVASVNVEKEVTMGELKISATLDDKTIAQDYEPGTYYETEGTIKNNGSISAMIKFTNNSKVKLAGTNAFVSLDKEAVVLTMSRAQDAGDGYWYTASDNGTYLALDPGEVANINLKIDFVGEKMGNSYMNAVIKADADLKATQIFEGAISSEFGIDSDTLIDLPEDSNLLRRATISPAMEYLQNKLNRGK